MLRRIINCTEPISDRVIERLLLGRWYRVWFPVGQINDWRNWYSQLPCLTFSNKRNSVKLSICVVDWWAGGSLTRRPKDRLLSPGQGNLVIEDVITIEWFTSRSGLRTVAVVGDFFLSAILDSVFNSFSLSVSVSLSANERWRVNGSIIKGSFLSLHIGGKIFNLARRLSGIFDWVSSEESSTWSVASEKTGRIWRLKFTPSSRPRASSRIKTVATVCFSLGTLSTRVVASFATSVKIRSIWRKIASLREECEAKNCKNR